MLDLLYDLALAIFAALPWCVPLFFFSSCGCCGCTPVDDSFDTDSRSSYSLTGSWGWSSGAVTATANDVFAIHTTAIDNGRGTVEVDCSGTAGLKTLLVGAYVDASNFAYLEITHHASSDTMKLYERVGGVDTQLGTTAAASAGSSSSLTRYFLCWDGQRVRAGRGANNDSNSVFPLIWEFCSLAGTRGGFGADASGGTVTVGRFLLIKHQIDGGTCPTCKPCPACSEFTETDTVQVVVTGVANGTCANCAVWNATWIIESNNHTAIRNCTWDEHSLAADPCVAATTCLMDFTRALAYDRLYLNYRTSGINAVLEWQLVQGGVARDCGEDVVFDLSATPTVDLFGGTTTCNWTAAEATVSAI